MNKNLTLAGAAVVVFGLSVVVGSLRANTPSEKNENRAIGEEVFFNPYTGLPCHKADAWSQSNHAGECLCKNCHKNFMIKFQQLRIILWLLSE